MIVDGVLMCGNCGMEFLAHSKIEIYEREKEDANECLYVKVEGRQLARCDGRRIIEINSEKHLSDPIHSHWRGASSADNPSSRRSGVAITFDCEGCSMKQLMTIAQHKGQTLIDFISEP